jgi:chemotaxis protein CheX
MSVVALAGRTATMNDLENGLKAAVTEVIATMFNCQPIIVPCNNNSQASEISAIVGYGGKVSGFIALHFSAGSACILASSLLGMSFDNVDDIVSDAMGEVVNMLAGGLKKHACRNEELFKISLPSIIRGNNYSTHAPKDSEERLLLVQAGRSSIMVQLVVERSKIIGNFHAECADVR